MRYKTAVRRIIKVMGDQEWNVHDLADEYNARYRNSMSTTQMTLKLKHSSQFEKVGLDSVFRFASKHKRKIILWRVKQ
tara:strand:- start:425 stop:658 length:234 start_codon:yes stop_codon:yes gene_type:complete